MSTLKNAVYTANNKTWNIRTEQGNGILLNEKDGTATPYTGYPLPPALLTLPEIPEDKKQELTHKVQETMAQITDRLPKSTGVLVIQTIVINNGTATVDYTIMKSKTMILR